VSTVLLPPLAATVFGATIPASTVEKHNALFQKFWGTDFVWKYEVDRVVDQYRTGQITLEDLGRIFEELAKSPLMQYIVIYAVEKQYVEPSGLTGEEKQAAHLTLQRVLRGMHEQKIQQDDLEPALDHLSVKKQDGRRQMRNVVTDGELRKFLAECQRVADQAGVPVEPFEIKISEEFRNAVDRALRSPHKPETPADGDASVMPGSPATKDASQADVPAPGNMPLEKEDPTIVP